MKRILSSLAGAVAVVILAGTTADAYAAQAVRDRPKPPQVTGRADDQRDREPIYRRVLRFAIKQLSNDLIPPRP